jgi:hypothetical protein
VISSNSSIEETGEAILDAATPDPAPRPVRRSFTAAYRLAVVAEYEAAPRGEKGAVLLSVSDLPCWVERDRPVPPQHSPWRRRGR